MRPPTEADEAWRDTLLALGDNRVLLPRLVQQVRSPKGVVPFVGAGLSAPYLLPQWGPLLRTLAPDEATRAEIDRLLAANEYEAAAEHVFDARGPERFDLLLRHVLGLEVDVAKPTAIARLACLPDGPIITTNFDRVIETVLRARGVALEVVVGEARSRLSEAFQFQRNAVLKIHGDLDDPASRVLTRREYDEKYARWLRTLLANAATSPLLFLGCSLRNDRPVAVLRELVREGHVLVRHFAILALPEPGEIAARTRELSEELHVDAVWFPAGEFHYIDRLLGYLAEQVPPERRRDHAARPKVRYRDIPAVPPQLFGRDVTDLVRLVESRPIVAVEGARGVGKTVFALHALRQFMDRPVFGALAWITASARKEALRLAHVLDVISLAIDYPFDVQTRDEDKESLLVKQLAESGTRCLLLLDNYETVADPQIDAFLFERRPPQLNVLITSTGRVARRDVQPFPLEELGPDAAATMFRERLSRDGLGQESDADVAALYAAVGGNPLAIEWVVGQMRAGHLLRSVLRGLTRGQADILQQVFRLAWDGLDPASRAVLAGIVLFVRPALEESLIAATGLGPDDFDDALRQLTVRYLVKRLHVHGDAGLGAGPRYLVHPFTRDFLEGTRQAHEAASAYARAAAFYVGYVRERGGTPDLESAAGWRELAAERDNVLAVLQGCWTHGLRAEVVPLVEAMARWLFVESHWNDLETWGARAVEAAVEGRALHAAGRILNEVGRTHSYRSRFAEAHAAFDRARELAATPPADRWALAYVGHHQAEALMRQKRPAEAEPLLRDSLDAFTALGDARSAIGVRYRMAMLAFDQRRYAEARKLARAGVADCVREDWARLEGFNRRLLGDIAVCLGETAEGRKQYESALSLVPAADMRIQALVELSLARLERTDGRHEEASRRAAVAVRHFEKLRMLKEAGEARLIRDGISDADA